MAGVLTEEVFSNNSALWELTKSIVMQIDAMECGTQKGNKTKLI